MRTTAIIVAAGQGARAGGLPKQFRLVAGRPLLAHTLAVFEAHPAIDEHVVVLPEPADWARHLEKACGPVWRVVSGGADRQASVAAGLETAGGDLVLIHDGARPFVGAALVTDVVEAAGRVGAALAAEPCPDTVKEVDGSMVRRTLDRSALFLAQTPQAFRVDLLRRAHRQAESDGVRGTDDAELVERLGSDVAVVVASGTNRKITTQEDLEWAERVLGGAAPAPSSGGGGK